MALDEHTLSGQRVHIHSPGGWEVLQLENFTPLEPKAGEVMVKITAIGVNFADIAVRLGLYESAKQLIGWPITPGFDLAGEIVAVGESNQEKLSHFNIGDRVFGVSFFGTYASHVTVPVDQLFRIPISWTNEKAAAFPTVHLTAWYALHHMGAGRAGQRALIHSAAGGVGLALIQLCHAAGIETVGIVRGQHKVKVAQDIGAHHVIDKANISLWQQVDSLAPDGFDLVFDANGYETIKQGYARLKPEGRLICFGAATMLKRGGGKIPWLRLAWRYLLRPKFDPLAMTSENRSVMGFNLSFLFHRKEMLAEAFTQLLSLEPPLIEQPQSTFSLDDVAKAHRHLESGNSVGKIILTPHIES